jgi:signal transduction histidine kinase
MSLVRAGQANRAFHTKTMANHVTAKKVAAPRSRGESVLRALPSEHRRLERLFDEVAWPDRRKFMRIRRIARKRALEALAGGGASDDAGRTALLVAATEMIVGMRAELSERPEDASWLGEQIESTLHISRLALAREVLRSPELLAVSPTSAVETQMAMLAALAPLRSVSLWTLDEAEQLRCMHHVGEGSPSRGAREAASRALAGESTKPGARRLLLALPVGRWRHPLAVLVGLARPGMGEACRAFLLDAAGMMGAVLERNSLLAANAASERALIESSERKLARLGFDLHDGPIQDIVVIAQDLRVLRDQLEPLLAENEQRERARGSFGYVESQLMSLEDALRRISNEVRTASVLLNRPFARALRDVAQAFAARTDIEPDLVLEGEFGSLSASQQIALLNIVQEALANVREHSNAKQVRIAVSANSEGVEAQVVDNGDGFDLEPTLIRAARQGRLGLVAMHERARMLGGQCRIDSRPGGPTVVSVALERWDPFRRGGHATGATD